MTEEFKTPASQREANKRYRDKNKEAMKWQSYRRGAKNYIKNRATQADLDEIKAWIAEKEKELNIN